MNVLEELEICARSKPAQEMLATWAALAAWRRVLIRRGHIPACGDQYLTVVRRHATDKLAVQLPATHLAAEA